MFALPPPTPRRLGAAIAIATTAALIATATPAQAAHHHHPRDHKIAHATRIVVAQKGDPYIYGAAGPSAFDCSGLMQYSYGHAGLYLPRTADDQYRHTRHIPLHNLRRGDFVYYHSGGHVFHVAMFAGRHNGQSYVIEAPHTGSVVQRSPIWDVPRWGGTLRIKH